MREAFAEVLRVATPLMISTGMFSVVLFADRTLLLWHDGAQMGASMAAGNLFWVVICPFVGIASMTGAIASQYVGAKQSSRIGRLLWQSVWFSLATLPGFLVVGLFSTALFTYSGQVESLIPMESAYFRILLYGGAGEVLQTALSGFFSGTHRTRVIMVISVISGCINLVLDALLIYGLDPAWWGGQGDRVGELGIVGAGIASVISFWFKAIAYGLILLLPRFRKQYGIFRGLCWDRRMMKLLIYFGFPAGLMYLTEALGFSVIVLMIGRLGDVPLQATTMAINFNMVAFVPLVGMSIAASVLVGQHLIESGHEVASRRVRAALMIGWAYSAIWGYLYLFHADWLIAFYSLNPTVDESQAAAAIARLLLGFVAIYVLLDATQLILAGALRGAGDTWFVMAAGVAVSGLAIAVGLFGQDAFIEWFGTEDGVIQNDGIVRPSQLRWWWWVLTAWVLGLALAMSGRYLQGKWKQMRMV